MKQKWMKMAAVVLIALSMCVPVPAAEPDSAGNLFVSGDMVSLPDTPFFGAVVAGQSVTVTNADAKGSVMAAGQSVEISNSKIGESLYMAGNSVDLKDSKVEGNFYAAGNSVSITGDSSCNGVYFAGNMITFEGETNGFFVGGSRVILKGTVNGDAIIEGDYVEIAEGAVITGELKVTSPAEPTIASDAKIGDVTFNQVDESETDAGKAKANASIGAKFLKKLSSGLYWIVAMAAFGMLLCWLFNDHLDHAKNMIKNRTGAMIASGAIGWACIPGAAIALCCTVILAPTAGILMVGYLLLILAGLAFAGASLARLIFPKMNVFLSALIGIAALELVRLIPVLGFIVGAAADMYLIGYVIQNRWLNRLKKADVAGKSDGEA